MDPVPRFSIAELASILERHGFVHIRPLGFGAFAEIHLAQNVKYKIPFAIKILKKNYDEQLQGGELKVMMSLDHHQIISFYSSFIENGCLFLVLEYCPNGTLDDYIKKHRITSEVEYAQIFKQIIFAVNFCHLNHVAHFDIKPANVLVDAYGRFKLADFGLAAFVDPGVRVSGYVGSPAFIAPEALHGNSYDPFKSDVWALGVTFFIVSNKCLPWPTKTRPEMEQVIESGVIGSVTAGPNVEAVVSAMLTLDPAKRPDLNQILQMPLFQLDGAMKKVKKAGSGAIMLNHPRSVIGHVRRHLSKDWGVSNRSSGGLLNLGKNDTFSDLVPSLCNNEFP